MTEPDSGEVAAANMPPGSVLAAGTVLVVIGVVGGVLRMLTTDPAATTSYGARAGALVGVVAALLAVIAGAMLLRSRWRGYAIFATVAATLLILTGIGIIATIAVPILLWTRDSAKTWFAPEPPIGLSPRPQ
ncbi:hypothetical protein [Gordonia sp. CPCC 205333]|uniref:hypothetical protein n=1 Tax=Gordonia sp. CPCC 205333 TaxID=3140790 RepID=UPI003AF34C96